MSKISLVVLGIFKFWLQSHSLGTVSLEIGTVVQIHRNSGRCCQVQWIFLPKNLVSFTGTLGFLWRMFLSIKTKEKRKLKMEKHRWSHHTFDINARELFNLLSYPTVPQSSSHSKDQELHFQHWNCGSETHDKGEEELHKLSSKQMFQQDQWIGTRVTFWVKKKRSYSESKAILHQQNQCWKVDKEIQLHWNSVMVLSTQLLNVYIIGSQIRPQKAVFV